MATQSAVMATDRTLAAIRKADRLPVNLVPDSSPSPVIPQSQTAEAQAQGIYVCKITGKSGAFYQVDVYAEGINNPATASGVYAYPLNLNFGASLPLGTLIMCSDQSFTATPSGGV